MVKVSEDLRIRRRERIRQIEWESQMPGQHERLPSRARLPERPWDEEREKILEREWYDRRSSRPSLPLPVPETRFIEKERIVVIRNER